MAAAAALVGSAWASLVCYTVSLSWLAWEREVSAAPRRVWTWGCLCSLLHMILAFGVMYGWSQAVAREDIGSQSEWVSGVRAPWGLFVNYAFGAVWLADLLWWWRVGDRTYRRRSAVSHWLVHGFFLFMLFNGGFVFVERWTRWIGLTLFCVSLWAALAVRSRDRNRPTA